MSAARLDRAASRVVATSRSRTSARAARQVAPTCVGTKITTRLLDGVHPTELISTQAPDEELAERLELVGTQGPPADRG